MSPMGDGMCNYNPSNNSHTVCIKVILCIFLADWLSPILQHEVMSGALEHLQQSS
jgi:hypothetical protein